MAVTHPHDAASIEPKPPVRAPINDAHRRLLGIDPDAGSMYELGSRHGAAILVVGATSDAWLDAAIAGATWAAERDESPPPQAYRLVPPASDADARRGTLQGRVAVFKGTLDQFVRRVPITPSMVIAPDADASTIARLMELAASDAPIVVAGRDIPSADRLRGASILRAPGSRSPRRPSEPTFQRHRDQLAGRESARAIRDELLGPSWRKRASARAPWPYAPADPPLPPTMPGGKPWPRISIITPSFNQGRYLEETILSVLHQRYPAVEHIVVDGGSTDETPAVLDRHRHHLAHAIQERDRGQSDAINKGMRLARGEILTWLNSDDMLAPGALASAAMALDHAGADLVAGEAWIQRDGRTVGRHLTSCAEGPIALDDLLDLDHAWNAGQFFYQPEVLFTRALWERAGGHVREDAFYSMDYELWLRMAHAGARLTVIGRPIALFRSHDQQKTADASRFKAELPKVRAEFLDRTGLRPNHRPARPAKTRLTIALVNDLGYAYGAGIAHRRLAECFALAGHQVRSIAATVCEPYREARRSTTRELVTRLESIKPDLVVVGNLHGADLDPGAVGVIAQHFETAVILHDQWWFTGRCAYPGSCERFKSGCGAACTCPGSYPAMSPDAIAPAWEVKRRVLGSCPKLTLLGNSRWAVEHAREAFRSQPGGPARVPPMDWIRFGVELDTFVPADKDTCRRALGLPTDAFIIMSSASAVSDERKGLLHLAEALRILELPDAIVVCCGWFSPKTEPPIPGMRAMGYMRDPRELARLYAAADVFVGPSLEEAFGQVFVEAAACGTPSIGYPVGGVPEAILDGVSGIVAHRVHPEALADAIETLHADPDLRRSMGRWARITAENHWSMSAAWSRFAQALRSTGVADRVGLGVKTSFRVGEVGPPSPEVLASVLPGFRPIRGFGAWEGPHPVHGLPRCRWMYGPTAELVIEAPRAGRARLVIAGRCLEDEQRVRVVQGSTLVAERAVPRTNHDRDHAMAIDLHVTEGENPVTLHFWRWNLASDRPLAFLATSIAVVMAP